MTTAVFEDVYQEYGTDFQDWIEEQDLNGCEKALWSFHYWMREHTDLGSGSIVDYRKYVAGYLNEDGELGDVPDDLGSHHKAAVNKFRDYAKTNAKGETQ